MTETEKIIRDEIKNHSETESEEYAKGALFLLPVLFQSINQRKLIICHWLKNSPELIEEVDKDFDDQLIASLKESK